MNISIGQNWLNKKKHSWVYSSSLPTKVGAGAISVESQGFRQHVQAKSSIVDLTDLYFTIFMSTGISENIRIARYMFWSVLNVKQ